jgi:hypothetical protein
VFQSCYLFLDVVVWLPVSLILRLSIRCKLVDKNGSSPSQFVLFYLLLVCFLHPFVNQCKLGDNRASHIFFRTLCIRLLINSNSPGDKHDSHDSHDSSSIHNENYPDLLTGPFGSKDKPVLVKSYFEERIVGCMGTYWLFIIFTYKNEVFYHTLFRGLIHSFIHIYFIFMSSTFFTSPPHSTW